MKGVIGKVKEWLKKDNAKMKYPDPKLGGPKPKPKVLWKNKKGQMLMVSILVMVMAIIVFVATLPAIKDVMNNARGCDYFNCAGYQDNDATDGSTSCASNNQTYLAELEEDKLGCIILDIFLPLLILSVLSIIIMKLMRGEPQPPAYGGYGGGY